MFVACNCSFNLNIKHFWNKCYLLPNSDTWKTSYKVICPYDIYEIMIGLGVKIREKNPRRRERIKFNDRDFHNFP